MDYSGLVYAIQNGDEREANRLCAKATPILKKYLILNVGASNADADDSIQRMFEYIIKKILDDDIENPHGLLQYMLTTSRHSYYKILKQRDRKLDEDLQEEPPRSRDQFWEIVENEEQEILQKCYEKMNDGYQEFFSFLYEFPDAEAADAAEYFNISNSNAWARKSRIVKQLRQCADSFY